MDSVRPTHGRQRYKHAPPLVAGTYVLVAACWVVLAEQGLQQQGLERWEPVKDLAFVGVTGVLLYVALRRLFQRIRASESALAQRAAELESIVGAMDDLVATVASDRTVVRAFGTWRGKMGKDPAALTGLSLTEALPHGTGLLLSAALDRAFAGQTIHTEVDLPTQHGPLVLAVTISPVRTPEGDIQHVLLVGRDVTSLRQIAASLERYRRLSESIPEIVVFSTIDGRILDANLACAAVFGYSEEELRGMSIRDLRAPDQVEDLADQLAAAASGGTMFETINRRRDGSLFPVEVTVTGTRLGEETVVINVVRDISQRRISEAISRIAAEIDRRIVQHQPLAVVLEYVCEELINLFGFTVVWVGLRREEGAVECNAMAGAADAIFGLDGVRWDGQERHPNPSGDAARTGLPQFGDVADYPGARWVAETRAGELRSYAALPLITQGQIVGCLSLFSRDEDVFTPDSIGRLQGIAGQIALSIMTAESQEKIRLQTVALESTAHAIVIADRHGEIKWVNAAFARLTGYSAEEAVGQSARILRSGSHSDLFYENLWNTILAGKVWRGEITNRRKDASTYIEEQTITPVKDSTGRITHFVSVKQDVTERKRYEELLQHLALHDPLTDLPNRRALDKSLEVAVGRAACGLPSALLLLDVDHFKIINDTVGHATGDQFLIALSKLLANLRRPGDLLARIGGDEFALLIDDATLPDAQVAAERLRAATESFRFHAGQQEFEPTVSVGLVPVDGTLEREGLMVLADAALYAAKDQGKNRVVHFGADQHPGAQTTETARWAYRIKEALRSQQFVLYYQPVVRLSTGAADHAEALIRLREPSGSITGPSSFLQAAEHFRLMPMIDRWVIEAVLLQLRNRPKLRLFVNLSGQSLSDESLLGQIETMVKAEHPSLAERLTFEITETAAVRDLGRAQQWMRHLTDLGCQFALDDFGMGFSSFSYLKALPVRYVKIDGSFIRNLDTDPTNRALVQSMTTVAHALGKAVVAEWVETEQIAQLLRELGVEYGQGYGLGVPSPDLHL